MLSRVIAACGLLGLILNMSSVANYQINYHGIEAQEQSEIVAGATCNNKEVHVTCEAGATCSGDCTKDNFEAGAGCANDENHQKEASSGITEECLSVADPGERKLLCTSPAGTGTSCTYIMECKCVRSGLAGFYQYKCKPQQASGSTSVGPYSQTNDCEPTN